MTTYSSRLLHELSKQHKITVLTFPHQRNLPLIEKKNFITIIRMPFLLRISKGYISPQSFMYFLGALKKADLVIINIPNFEGILLALLARLKRKKILSLFHCEVFLGSNICSRIVNMFLNISVFIQLLVSNKIVTHTQDYFQNTSQYWLWKNKTRYMLPAIEKLNTNLSYLNVLRKKKRGHIWIGFIGRIAREKGIEYLINAIEKLSLIYPHMCLVLAGPNTSQVVGEKQYQQYINNRIRISNIKILELGQLHHNQMGAFYKSIDLLVLPSLNKTESFGIVQVEAMLMGTPVVSTDIPGLRIPVNLTHMGIVVKPKSGLALSEAIRHIIENPQTFSNSKYIQNTERIFSSRNILKQLLS